MQQEGRKKTTAKHSGVTNVIGLLLACLLGPSPNNVFFVFFKTICLKESEFWWTVISNKIIVMFVSHKVCCLLSSHVVLSKFTNIRDHLWLLDLTRSLCLRGDSYRLRVLGVAYTSFRTTISIHNQDVR